MKVYAFQCKVIKKCSSLFLALSQITPCGGSNYPSMETQTAHGEVYTAQGTKPSGQQPAPTCQLRVTNLGNIVPKFKTQILLPQSCLQMTTTLVYVFCATS